MEVPNPQSTIQNRQSPILSPSTLQGKPLEGLETQSMPYGSHLTTMHPKIAYL